MTEAISILSNHKFDLGFNQNNTIIIINNRNESNEQIPRLCFAQLEADLSHKTRPKLIWYMKTGQVFVNTSTQSPNQSANIANSD
jgi:hypothetical protein